jgi:hypothetical protein
MFIWSWLMDLWFGPVKPEQKVETLITSSSEWNTPEEASKVTSVTTIGAGGGAGGSGKSTKKSTKKPKATIEGDAKLLYTNENEKQKVLPASKNTKPKKGK